MDLIREHWTQNDYEAFRNYLKSLADEKYRNFSSRLIPDTSLIYGIRTPLLRKTAKEISKGNFIEFLDCQKTDYHEEIIIEGLVMAQIKCGYPEMLGYMKIFADKIYNWAICDTVSFKRLKNHLDLFIDDADYFIYNENPWVVRFGFGCLMEFCLTEKYIDRVLDYVSSVDSDFYYVHMMQAWLVATAAAKQRDKAIEFLQAKKLNPVTQGMAIKKMRESYRISKEDKELAKSFKY